MEFWPTSVSQSEILKVLFWWAILIFETAVSFVRGQLKICSFFICMEQKVWKVFVNVETFSPGGETFLNLKKNSHLDQ